MPLRACPLALPVSLLLLLPIALAHDTTAGNRVTNGGFDANLNGWTFVPSQSAMTWWSPAVPCPSGSTLTIPNQVLGGSYIRQTVSTATGYSVLDFSARVTNPSNPGPQMVEIFAGPAGAESFLVRVIFAADAIGLVAYNSPVVTVPADLAGCHHYTVALNDVSRTAILYQDTTPLVHVASTALFVPFLSGTLLVGDVAWDDAASGAAPTVEYDGIYFGPT